MADKKLLKDYTKEEIAEFSALEKELKEHRQMLENTDAEELLGRV